ncbi:Uncharacterised protein [Salmonella enterica]|uniref:Uncharacterized protein n=1 Tax=Salmonella enterica TaxID=28901 RepID=A0A7D8ELE3_SALER|nr:Uncharacterised protein [Salmonella enterica]
MVLYSNAIGKIYALYEDLGLVNLEEFLLLKVCFTP